MENPRRSTRGVEENVMAIFDSSGVKEARDIHDDRLSFLEAVRAATLAAESSDIPTWKMYDAIFQILSDGTSLELIIASYQLLIELDKRYPRVCLVQADKSNSFSAGVCELVVAKEGWSPFIVGLESTHSDGGIPLRNSHKLFDPSRFSLLVQDIAQAVNEMDFDLKLKPLKDMLVFQYLVSVMEGDFLSRQNVYKETMNWVLLRESLLNTIMVSRRLIFKSLVRDCMSIISRRCHHVGSSLTDLENPEKSSAKTIHDCHVALAISVSEFEKRTYIAVQKLLTLVMELDAIKKEEDVQGSTSRADGSRTPLLEIILDELTYNKDLISPFLQGFSEPKWKLEIILQYFWKYCSKSSVRTRRSNVSSDDATFESVLSHFSNAASAKIIGRKITIEVSQLLLAHAFRAYLSLQSGLEYVANNGENVGSSLVQICRGIISAFQNLKGTNKNMDIIVPPLEKEALFTAATLLSIKS